MTLRLCEGCRRPKTVCLCAAYPQPPVEVSGQIVILQHPLEQRRTLATVPLLEASLKHCSVIRHRNFQLAKHPKLYQLLQQVKSGDLTGYLLFPGSGSKDLTQVVSSNKEGNCPPASHLSHSCSSTAESQGSQRTNPAFGPQSPLGEGHKDTKPECVFYSDGTTLPHSNGRIPKESGGTTPQHVGDVTVQQHSDGTTLPPSGGTTSGHTDGTTPLHSAGTTPTVLGTTTSSAVFDTASSAKPARQQTGLSLSTPLRDATLPPGGTTNDAHGALNANAKLRNNVKSDSNSEFGANLWRPHAPPYVLFAIDGTWQEAKEIYKVRLQLLQLC
ncbi:hypothetical protein ABBQ38_014981 [Trebouxia sp. C0009 RCD-2024]